MWSSGGTYDLFCLTKLCIGVSAPIKRYLHVFFCTLGTWIYNSHVYFILGHMIWRKEENGTVNNILSHYPIVFPIKLPWVFLGYLFHTTVLLLLSTFLIFAPILLSLLCQWTELLDILFFQHLWGEML